MSSADNIFAALLDSARDEHSAGLKIWRATNMIFSWPVSVLRIASVRSEYCDGASVTRHTLVTLHISHFSLISRKCMIAPSHRGNPRWDRAGSRESLGTRSTKLAYLQAHAFWNRPATAREAQCITISPTCSATRNIRPRSAATGQSQISRLYTALLSHVYRASCSWLQLVQRLAFFDFFLRYECCRRQLPVVSDLRKILSSHKT